jgi:hypothetical protein
MPTTGTAGVLTIEPELSLGGEYSTNPQLRLDVAKPGEAAVAKIGMPLDWSTDASTWRLAPRGRFAVASGDSGMGAQAGYLVGSGEVRSELSKLTARAQWSDDSSVVRQPDAGTLLRSDVRQRGLDTSIDWTRVLTERTTVDATVGYQRVDYGARPAGTLYDYRVRTGSAQLNRRLSERVSLQVIAGRSRYELPETRLSNVSTFQEVGVQWSLSPLWTVKGLVGRSRASATGQRRAPTGTVYSAGVDRQGQRLALSATVQQSLQPSGFGSTVRSRETSARASWGFTERVSGSLSGRLATTTDVFGELQVSARRYRSAEAGLHWQAAMHWDVDLLASYAQVDLDAGLLYAAAAGRGTGASVSVTRRFGRIHLK